MLATAADALVAHAVADHLGLFDEVVCSDGIHNLKGAAKAIALEERFGKNGFDYAGNDGTDLQIWRAARKAIAVNASHRICNKLLAHTPLEARFDNRSSLFRSALKAMRPHQWSKNLLVFVPMVMAHAVTAMDAWVCRSLHVLSFMRNGVLHLSCQRPRRPRGRPSASTQTQSSTGERQARAPGGHRPARSLASSALAWRR